MKLHPDPDDFDDDCETDEDETYEPVVKWRKPPGYVCTHCKAGNCTECIDIIRILGGLGEICKCQRKKHSGEPVNEQVRDPTTGSVFGPGLEVTQDGEVLRSVPPAIEP